MKIAMVFDGLGLGGIERVGIDYINIMQGLGYEVDVYNLNPGYNEMENQLPEGCHVIHHSFSHKLCPELYSYGVKKWWWGKFAYPVIHTGLFALLGVRRAFKNQREKEYDLAIAFSGHFNDLTFVASGFITAKKKLCWLHGALSQYLLVAHGYGTIYRKIKNLITLSDYMQDAAFIGNKFLSDVNINKLYNPVSISNKKVDNSLVEKLKREYGEFFLSVGRFTKQKDQITIVKAMKILKEKYGINNKVIFIGDGEEKTNVQGLVEELGLLENTVFMGHREDVQNFYAAAKLFVHSSPAEGLPTVLIEAMSFGVPVVATKSLPGVDEILCNEEYGLICPIGDADEMAKSINKMVNDRGIYNHYEEKSYERSKWFSPENIAIQLKYIFQRLI
jgi:glycosyltransferase involved in cell wall biosynthesis